MKNPSGAYWPTNQKADYKIEIVLSSRYKSTNKTVQYEAIGMDGVMAFLTSEKGEQFLSNKCKIIIVKQQIYSDDDE